MGWGDVLEAEVVVMGNGGVGKSSVVIQFVQGIFAAKYDVTIEDSYIHRITLDNKEYSLWIYDSAGTEQFTAMRDLYISRGEGFILVFSVTSKVSFDAVIDIRDQIFRLKGNESQCPLILVGNKIDLTTERVISKQQGEERAAQLGAACYIETSALTGENCAAVFQATARELLNKQFFRKRSERERERKSKYKIEVPKI